MIEEIFKNWSTEDQIDFEMKVRHGQIKTINEMNAFLKLEKPQNFLAQAFRSYNLQDISWRSKNSIFNLENSQNWDTLLWNFKDYTDSQSERYTKLYGHLFRHWYNTPLNQDVLSLKYIDFDEEEIILEGEIKHRHLHFVSATNNYIEELLPLFIDLNVNSETTLVVCVPYAQVDLCRQTLSTQNHENIVLFSMKKPSYSVGFERNHGYICMMRFYALIYFSEKNYFDTAFLTDLDLVFKKDSYFRNKGRFSEFDLGLVFFERSNFDLNRLRLSFKRVAGGVSYFENTEIVKAFLRHFKKCLDTSQIQNSNLLCADQICLDLCMRTFEKSRELKIANINQNVWHLSGTLEEKKKFLESKAK